MPISTGSGDPLRDPGTKQPLFASSFRLSLTDKEVGASGGMQVRAVSPFRRGILTHASKPIALIVVPVYVTSHPDEFAGM